MLWRNALVSEDAARQQSQLVFSLTSIRLLDYTLLGLYLTYLYCMPCSTCIYNTHLGFPFTRLITIMYKIRSFKHKSVSTAGACKESSNFFLFESQGVPALRYIDAARRSVIRFKHSRIEIAVGNFIFYYEIDGKFTLHLILWWYWEVGKRLKIFVWKLIQWYKRFCAYNMYIQFHWCMRIIDYLT